VRAAEAHGLRVGVLTKGELDQATTRWAQGGVAAVLGGADPDSTDMHLADTLAAGAGLCDVGAVRVLVDEGPGRVNELIALGAAFDRNANGDLALAREGGHSHPRVVHAGGAATGREVERALVVAVRRTAAAVYERWFACDLVVEHGRCVGVTAQPAGSQAPVEIRARHVLVATGGAGQLFAVTTNPAEATGDGIAMALRAGAAVADLEFVQFHPTALHHPTRPRPLLSEALRGHGALLRDTDGKRFVDELLPRDQVSRAVHARMADQGATHLWLDATGLEGFAERFPTIARVLSEAGLDPSKDWLPVAPAAHYTCGGIMVDLDGASTLPGLWVAGEAACNGVHGANRLASNSLLDGMVFGPRVVEAVERGKDGPDPTGVMHEVLTEGSGLPLRLRQSSPDIVHSYRNIEGMREGLQQTMSADAGVVRSAESLGRARTAAEVAAVTEADHPSVEAQELGNLALVGRALCIAAAAREESRGAHSRRDFPEPSPRLRRRLVVCGD
jgi:L-aspartate oxidase